MLNIIAVALATSFTLVNCEFTLNNHILSLFPRMSGPPAHNEQNDGKYTFTSWSDFGECSKVCGGGRRARMRSCLNSTGHPVILEKCYDQLPIGSYDLYTIIKYGSKTLEEDEEICNKFGCQTSEWSLESECTRECGGGTTTRSRTCLNSVDQNKCNFQSKRLVPCNTQACFIPQEWQEWTSCSKVCGVGETIRIRECLPNVPQGSSKYHKLLVLIKKFKYGSVLINNGFANDEEVYYFSHYLNACSRLHQKRFCNVWPCPACPKNQEYHTCLPCTKHCERMTYGELKNFNFDIFEVLTRAKGCNGKCEHGCGCPPFTPYLGMDGVCYQLPILCPNHASHYFLRILGSNVPEQTTKPPTTAASVTSTKPTMRAATNATVPITSTTIATTTTNKITNVAKYQRNLPSADKPVCPKDIPILQHDYCSCSGVFKDVPCVAKPGQKCPIICRDIPTCPNKLSPRLKNAPECSLPECDSNDECPNEGSLCCELLCGRRCIGGVVQ